MYINTTTNEYPITIATIRAAHPNTSIPAGVDLSHLGYAHVHGSAQPEGEVVEETTPELGALTTIDTGYLVGKAISATEILVGAS